MLFDMFFIAFLTSKFQRLHRLRCVHRQENSCRSRRGRGRRFLDLGLVRLIVIPKLDALFARQFINTGRNPPGLLFFFHIESSIAKESRIGNGSRQNRENCEKEPALDFL